MAVKQLEDPKVQYLPKVIFILLLILSASFLFKLAQNKKFNQAVLGKNTNSQKKENNVSLADLKKQGENVYNQISNSAQKEAGLVLGTFTDLISDTASKSADTVKEYIFTNTVGNVLKQIDKLPSQEKEMIKKEVCK